MNTMRGIWASILASTLTACGGGSSSTAGLVKVSGDGQTVVQHQTAPAPMEVQLLDAMQHGVVGAVVTFSSGSPSVYITPAQVTTDSQGKAGFTGYLHSTGTVLVTASAPGYPSATFSANVTAAGHPFDGIYAITNTVTRVGGYSPPTNVTVQINDAAALEAQLPLGGTLLQIGLLDASSGLLTLDRKPCGTVCSNDTFAGTLVMDMQGRVTGSGTITQNADDNSGLAGPVGTWTAVRL